MGWRPGGGGFALSDGCIGSARTKREVLPPRWAFANQACIHQCSGTLARWQRQVAGPACCSTRLMLAIAAAFAFE
jgi:hypothetical protein